jgi:hypothetical protein
LEPSNGHGYLGRLSAYWNASFPGERPSTPVLPEPLTAVEFELEGQVQRAVSVGWGDTGFSTLLHLPCAAAVIGGDVAYSGVYTRSFRPRPRPRKDRGHAVCLADGNKGRVFNPRRRPQMWRCDGARTHGDES